MSSARGAEGADPAARCVYFVCSCVFVCMVSACIRVFLTVCVCLSLSCRWGGVVSPTAGSIMILSAVVSGGQPVVMVVTLCAWSIVAVAVGLLLDNRNMVVNPPSVIGPPPW